MPRPRKLSETLDVALPTSSPAPLFETVPAVMERGGRVAGFEALRDLLLNNWQVLAASYNIPLQGLLKLVLETDRHALFAAISEEKLGDADQSKHKRLKAFQEYLEGETSVPSLNEDNDGRDEDVQG